MSIGTHVLGEIKRVTVLEAENALLKEQIRCHMEPTLTTMK